MGAITLPGGNLRYFIDKHGRYVRICANGRLYKYLENRWQYAFSADIALPEYLMTLKPLSEKYVILHNLLDK